MIAKSEDLLASKKRDKVEIMAGIIAITQKASGITHIVRNVNLCSAVVTKYLKIMHKRNLIKSNKLIQKGNRPRKVYEATKKGLDFLEVYCQLLRIIYGKDFLEKADNLAVACIKYYQMNELK
ncbi:MAG: winged helix-turn-helix domain-containing protein [Candidatus Bathyarchaeota archaeon]|jgi:predicted transcriptional regulator